MAIPKSTTVVLCVFASLAVLAGEPEAKGGAAGKRPGSMDEMLAAIPKAPLDEGVLLQSGDIKVLMASVAKTEEAYLAMVKRQQPQLKPTPAQLLNIRKMIAFRLLLNALVEKYVTDNKVEVDKPKSEAEFEKLKQAQKAQGGSYEQFLADNGLSDAEFRRVWQATWAIQEKLAKTVADDEVNKVLDTQELRRASHVLFMYKGSERAPATVTRTKEEAKTAAEDVIKKLQAGEDIATIAKAQSDCTSKADGGDLRFLARKGKMVEAFADATYKLAKVGDYTATPVESPFGYHVIKLTELKNTDELMGQIRSFLGSQKMNAQMQEIAAAGVAGAKFNEKLMPADIPAQVDKAEK